MQFTELYKINSLSEYMRKYATRLFISLNTDTQNSYY